MNRRFNYKTVILITICFGLGILTSYVYQRMTGPKQTVSVSGQGEIDAPVDQATIGVQIKNTSDSYSASLEENRKNVKDLKVALKKLGINESRITQSSYSPPYRLLPEEPGFDNSDMSVRKAPNQNGGTTVSTNVEVNLDSLKNIEKVFRVIDENPNTKITNTHYSLRNQKSWEKKAREEALKDVREQVESIAKINKLKVGKLVAITDGSTYQEPLGDKVELLRQGNSINPGESGVEAEVESGSEALTNNPQTVKIYASYTATYELR